MKMNIQNLLRNEIMLKEIEGKKFDARLGLWGAILVSDKLQSIGRSNTYIVGEAMPYDIWSEKLRIEVKTSLPATKRGHYAGFSSIRPEFFDYLVLVRVHEDWGNSEFWVYKYDEITKENGFGKKKEGLYDFVIYEEKDEFNYFPSRRKGVTEEMWEKSIKLLQEVYEKNFERIVV